MKLGASQRANAGALHTGYAPGRFAIYRPPMPVLAVTPDSVVERRLAFVWGVRPWSIPRPRNTEDLLASAFAGVRDSGVARAGDTIVLTGSAPVDVRGRTNFLQVHVLD